MKIAVVRMAGQRRKNREIEDTFKMLRLPSQYSCTVVEDNKSSMGMIKKIKDHSTFGTINEETLKLLKKREDKGKGCYRLHPPIGGFERKGTKKSFKEGGALGNRGDKINDLLKRMI